MDLYTFGVNVQLHNVSKVFAACGIEHVLITAGHDFSHLKATDTVRVFHGTQNMESGIITFLRSGMDGTKVVGRSYNQGAERGLYVAPDQRTARSFGSIVIEFDVKAKDLYPTARWGFGMGHRQKQIQEMAAEKFPNSFRPLVSWQLTEKVEPQAMFLGFVPASKIIAVHRYEISSSVDFTTYTLAEARERYLGENLVDPKGDETYDEVLELLAKSNGETPADISDALADARESEIMHLLLHHGFGRKASLRFITEHRKRK